MKRILRILAVSLVLVLALTACGKTTTTTTETEGPAGTELTFDAASLPIVNEGEPIEGGILEYGLVKDSPFMGIFSSVLYEDAYDGYLISLMNGGNLYDSDQSFRIISSDKVEITYDDAAKTITWKLNPDLKWSDGTPVTSKDLEYSYYVVGSPDYTGVRYDEREDGRVLGMTEYHAGNAETITGLTTPDDQTLVVEYTELTPATHWGSGMQPTLIPYHYVKDIAIADLAESDEIRIKPLTWGPYHVTNIVQGESVEFSANPHYYKGKPALDKINVSVLPKTNVVEAMKAHTYDMLSEVPSESVNELLNVPGYQMVAKGDFYYSYLGFNLGNLEEGKIVVNPDAKMADVNLRKALGYALDQESVAKKFYDGHNTLAKSTILPIFTEFYNEDIPGYYYDVEKANQLLDEAGYLDVNDDGFREDPNGDEFIVNLAMMQGGDIQEPLSQYYIQSWEEVGIKAELTTGKLIEFNAFYDMVQASDPGIDVFAAAWGVGTNPSPAETYGSTADFNMSRYTSETLQEPIDKIISMEAADPAFLAQAYRDFQQAVYDEVPAIPLQWRSNWTIVNNRVLNVDAGYGNGAVVEGSGAWALSADAPITE